MNSHLRAGIEKENLYVVGQWWSVVTDNNKTIEAKNTANDTKVLLMVKRTTSVKAALKTITTYNSTLLGNLFNLFMYGISVDGQLLIILVLVQSHSLIKYHFSFWISSKQSSSIFNYWKFHCRQKILLNFWNKNNIYFLKSRSG